MEPIQVVAVLFAAFSLSRVILRYKDQNVSFREFIFWTIVWVSIIFVAIEPGAAGYLSRLVGVERPLDMAIYVSIIVLFYLIFRLYVHQQNLERNITKMVREMAKNEKTKK